MTIAEELVTALNGNKELAAQLEAAKADTAAAIAAGTESVNAVAKERDAALEAGKALTVEIDTLKAAQDKATADLTAVRAELDVATGELAKAKGALRDPAMAAAALTESEAVPAGAEGGQSKSRAQLEAEYAAIDGASREGAQARADFRAKHKVALGL